MKVLILGGTRFLGRYLVEAAHTRNHEVTLFNRGWQNRELFTNVETLYGDRDGDLAPLRGRTWDAVIDTSGFVPRVVSRSAQLLRDQTDHYTFISSMSVYDDLSEPGVAEESPVQGMDPQLVDEITRGTAGPIYGPYYGALKVLCEQAAEAAMPGRVLSVRAGQIVGPHDYTDRLPYWVRRVSQGNQVLAPGRPERQIQIIDVRDLSAWIISMSEAKQGGVFNASGPDHLLTMGDLLDECKATTGSDAAFTWVSEAFLREQGVGPWGEMPLWIPETFPLSPEGEKPANGFLAINTERAIRAGLTFRPLADTLRDTLAWELTRPAGEDRKAGITAEREAELLTNWRSAQAPLLG